MQVDRRRFMYYRHLLKMRKYLTDKTDKTNQTSNSLSFDGSLLILSVLAVTYLCISVKNGIDSLVISGHDVCSLPRIRYYWGGGSCIYLTEHITFFCISALFLTVFGLFWLRVVKSGVVLSFSVILNHSL